MKKLFSFKWARKTAARLDRDNHTSQDNNEYYRNLLQQFTSSCHASNGDISDPGWIIYRPKEQNAEQSKKTNGKSKEQAQFISGVPHIRASEIFEIGCVVGTESQFLELVSAEWHNMKITMKRNVFASCHEAIKREVEVLREIRHPNILLLMGTTRTNVHDLVSIFEPVDCTLHSYIHERGERMNTQGIMQIGIKLADVLKYCHTRGYIHSAINSRCVYFTSNNTVKLGGWEMAVEMGIPYQFREYEKYLRLENLKWEPPGTCYGEYHNKKIDVYGLMLLLWEMCTGRVPRSKYNQNVERHHMIRKRDVIVSLQNVPPILHDLLETGLHPDETKITLDMDKIGRRLHRLLMILEEEEKDSTCMNKCGNNNNDLLYNDKNALYKKTFSVSSLQDKALIRKPIAKLSHCPMIEKKSSSNQFLKFKKKQYNEDLDPKNNIEKKDASVIDDSIVSSMINNKVKTTIPCTRCAEISDIMYNMDEVNDARANIKRLKELIASKREDFFFGNDSVSSYSTTSPKATSTLLSEEKSPTHITCKPASHTITIEPKCKSPNEYNGTIPKSSYISQRKTPYVSMPASIKQAIIQPRILHSDTKSFYESTLWKKEKEICISRMGRDSKEQIEDLSLLQQSSYNDTPITDDDKAQYSKPDLTNGDATYTIEFKKKGNYTKEELPLKDTENDYISTKASTFSNKSIQDLKDALDRATEIVRSVTPSKICTSKLNWTNTKEFETVLKDLYETKYDKNQNRVEKWTPGNSNFLEINKARNTENNIGASIRHEEMFNQAFINSETFSSTAMKTLNESRMSMREQYLSDLQKTDHMITSNLQQTRDFDSKTHEMEYVNVDTISNSPAIKDSPRRRSLPARLNTLTIMSVPKITHKKNLPASQYLTEDMYIDDEFGSRLNYNLLLLDDELHLLNTLKDNESLPQTTEL